MRIIKLGIISLVFFAVFLTILSFFFPSRVRISKAINIYSKKDSVLAQIKNGKQWKKWYPGMESIADSAFSTEGVMLDFSDPRKATYIIIDRPKSLGDSVIAATVDKGNEGNNIIWSCTSYTDPNTRDGTELVTVQWYMDIHLGWYPWDKFSSLLLEKRYGPVMEKGLEKLKALLEK